MLWQSLQDYLNRQMKIRLAELQDLSSIMEIIGHAQQFLAEQNIDQWQDGYPPKEWVITDITEKECFVVENSKNQIIATTVFITRNEPNYNIIRGNWLTGNDAKYGVVHRLAIHKDFRRLGIANFLMVEFEKQLKKKEFNSMRIDTHKDNTGMQRLLKKMGYVYCGVIYLESGDERLAFEKVLG